MPYIKQEKRKELDKIVDKIYEETKGNWFCLSDEYKRIETNGSLNYVLFAYCKRYVKPSYHNYKTYIGLLRNILNDCGTV